MREPRPMYGEELLELITDLGLDAAILESFELASSPASIGPDAPVEAIVREYTFDGDGFVLTDDDGMPVIRRRVVVLYSMRTAE